MEAARKLLVKGRRPPSYSDAAENNTSVAEQLWTAGAKRLRRDAAGGRALEQGDGPADGSLGSARLGYGNVMLQTADKKQQGVNSR